MLPPGNVTLEATFPRRALGTLGGERIAARSAARADWPLRGTSGKAAPRHEPVTVARIAQSSEDARRAADAIYVGPKPRYRVACNLRCVVQCIFHRQESRRL